MGPGALPGVGGVPLLVVLTLFTPRQSKAYDREGCSPPRVFIRTPPSSLDQKFLTFLGSPCGESNASYKRFPQKNSNIILTEHFASSSKGAIDLRGRLSLSSGGSQALPSSPEFCRTKFENHCLGCEESVLSRGNC